MKKSIWRSKIDYSFGNIFNHNNGYHTVVSVIDSSYNGITKSHHKLSEALKRAKSEAKKTYVQRVFIQGLNNICLQIK